MAASSRNVAKSFSRLATAAALPGLLVAVRLSLAIWVSSVCAASNRPLASSHLGDSGKAQ